jgi:hypothetical protein
MKIENKNPNDIESSTNEYSMGFPLAIKKASDITIERVQFNDNVLL